MGKLTLSFLATILYVGKHNFQPYVGVLLLGVLFTIKRMFNSTFGKRTPTHLLRVATIVRQTPFVFATTLVLFNFQPFI
jgi:hypothetical protein